MEFILNTAEPIWDTILSSVKELGTCFAHAELCFNFSITDNIFVFLFSKILYFLFWLFCCGPQIFRWIIISLLFQHAVKSFTLPRWALLASCFAFCMIPKPFFDFSTTIKRDHFVLDDVSSVLYYLILPVILFSVMEIPKNIQQVAIPIADWFGLLDKFDVHIPDALVECYMPATPGARGDIEMGRLLADEKGREFTKALAKGFVPVYPERRIQKPKQNPFENSAVPGIDFGIGTKSTKGKTRRLRKKLLEDDSETSHKDPETPKILTRAPTCDRGIQTNPSHLWASFEEFVKQHQANVAGDPTNNDNALKLLPDDDNSLSLLPDDDNGPSSPSDDDNPPMPPPVDSNATVSAEVAVQKGPIYTSEEPVEEPVEESACAGIPEREDIATEDIAEDTKSEAETDLIPDADNELAPKGKGKTPIYYGERPLYPCEKPDNKTLEQDVAVVEDIADEGKAEIETQPAEEQEVTPVILPETEDSSDKVAEPRVDGSDGNASKEKPSEDEVPIEQAISPLVVAPTIASVPIGTEILDDPPKVVDTATPVVDAAPVVDAVHMVETVPAAEEAPVVEESAIAVDPQLSENVSLTGELPSIVVEPVPTANNPTMFKDDSMDLDDDDMMRMLHESPKAEAGPCPSKAQALSKEQLNLRLIALVGEQSDDLQQESQTQGLLTPQAYPTPGPCTFDKMDYRNPEPDVASNTQSELSTVPEGSVDAPVALTVEGKLDDVKPESQSKGGKPRGRWTFGKDCYKSSESVSESTLSERSVASEAPVGSQLDDVAESDSDKVGSEAQLQQDQARVSVEEPYSPGSEEDLGYIYGEQSAGAKEEPEEKESGEEESEEEESELSPAPVEEPYSPGSEEDLSFIYGEQSSGAKKEPELSPAPVEEPSEPASPKDSEDISDVDAMDESNTLSLAGSSPGHSMDLDSEYAADSEPMSLDEDEDTRMEGISAQASQAASPEAEGMSIPAEAPQGSDVEMSDACSNEGPSGGFGSFFSPGPSSNWSSLVSHQMGIGYGESVDISQMPEYRPTAGPSTPYAQPPVVKLPTPQVSSPEDQMMTDDPDIVLSEQELERDLLAELEKDAAEANTVVIPSTPPLRLPRPSIVAATQSQPAGVITSTSPLRLPRPSIPDTPVASARALFNFTPSTDLGFTNASFGDLYSADRVQAEANAPSSSPPPTAIATPVTGRKILKPKSRQHLSELAHREPTTLWTPPPPTVRFGFFGSVGQSGRPPSPLPDISDLDTDSQESEDSDSDEQEVEDSAGDSQEAGDSDGEDQEAGDADGDEEEEVEDSAGVSQEGGSQKEPDEPTPVQPVRTGGLMLPPGENERDAQQATPTPAPRQRPQPTENVAPVMMGGLLLPGGNQVVTAPSAAGPSKPAEPTQSEAPREDLQKKELARLQRLYQKKYGKQARPAQVFHEGRKAEPSSQQRDSEARDGHEAQMTPGRPSQPTHGPMRPRESVQVISPAEMIRIEKGRREALEKEALEEEEDLYNAS